MLMLIWVFAGHTCHFIVFVMLSLSYVCLWVSVICLYSNQVFPDLQSSPLNLCGPWSCTPGILRWTYSIFHNKSCRRQHSSPESCLANKIKCIWQKKNELNLTSVWGCSIFWPPAPPLSMHPGVSSYGMEADPIWNKNAFWWLTDVI